jgi:hypothetical protein
MRFTLTAILLACGLTLLGCETAEIDGPMESSTPGSSPVTPAYLLDELTAEVGGAGMGAAKLADGSQAVTGSAEIEFATVAQVRKVTVHAIRHPDGTFSGHYRVRDWIGGVEISDFRGLAVGLAILGNRAVVLGSNFEPDPFSPGLVQVHSINVTDNGKGKDALPDQVSVFFTSVPAEAVNRAACTGSPPFGGTQPVTKGDIEVQP